MLARGTSLIGDFHAKGHALAAITTWSVDRG